MFGSPVGPNSLEEGPPRISSNARALQWFNSWGTVFTANLDELCAETVEWLSGLEIPLKFIPCQRLWQNSEEFREMLC